MSTDAVTLPDSAPAAIETEVTPQERLDHASSADLATWRKTGDLPPVKPVKEAAPAPVKEEPKSEIEMPNKDASAASPLADAADSPAAQPQKKHRDKTKEDTARRFEELLNDNKSLKQRLEEIERRSAQPAISEKPAPQPEAKAEAKGLRARPKIDDIDPVTKKAKYESYEQFSDDLVDWGHERALAEVDARLSKRDQERTQQEQAKITQEQQKVLSDGLNRKFDEGRKKHADFDAVALNKDLLIPMGSVTDVFLLDSDHAAEVAYYLGQHPEVLDSFYGDYDLKTGKFTNKINAMKQHRKLIEIESEVSEAPKPEPVTTPARKEPVKLPPPPREVDGRNASPVDEAESALARGDTAAYMRAMNARELKARKG